MAGVAAIKAKLFAEAAKIASGKRPPLISHASTGSLASSGSDSDHAAVSKKRVFSTASSSGAKTVLQSEAWYRKTKTLKLDMRSKKVQVEWHFVTDDDLRHSVAIQHTQAAAAVTQRVVLVDGEEVYKDKNSHAVFRIEIGKDVAEITISLEASTYMYELTLNGLVYSEAQTCYKSAHEEADDDWD